MPLPPLVSHPDYQAPLRADHRFPMGKYGLLRDAIVAAGLVPDGFVEPEPASPDLMERVHGPAYVAAVFGGRLDRATEKRIGLPVDPGVVRRSRLSVAGTLLAARLALRHGLAGSTAGGSHHARPETGSGFCVFNDVAIAARALAADGTIRSALVIDLDVHQGDGTAACLAANPDLFTFSLHAEKNFPFEKIPSDLDVGLPDGTGDTDYLAAVRHHVPRLLDGLAPDLVFYNAGVDPHADDRLGRLALSDDGLRRRDAFVIGEARRRGVPLVAVIGGGYADDVAALARRHAIVFTEMAGAG